MKILFKTTALLLLLLLFSSCSVSFDKTTPKQTMEIQNTLGFYIEGEVAVPEDALNDNISFDSIEIIYTVRKTGNFVASISVYVSDTQTADNSKDDDDQKIIDLDLSSSEDQKSGVISSDKLKDILNSGQTKFVIGAENLSTSATESVYIDIQLHVSGDYSIL